MVAQYLVLILSIVAVVSSNPEHFKTNSTLHKNVEVGIDWAPSSSLPSSKGPRSQHHRSCELGSCNAEYAGCAKHLERLWNPILRTNKVHSSRSLGRCAVVSSSDTLLYSKCGKAIDDHDTVLRFNFASNAPAYYSDLGSKTTYMFSHGSNFHAPGHALGEMGLEFQNKISTYLAHAGISDVPNAEWGRLPSIVIQSMCAKCRYDPNLKCANKCTVAFCIALAGCRASGFECGSISMDILREATQSYAKLFGSRNSKPSSGWVGLHWANRSCDVVDAYGFPLYSSGRHYYEKEDKQSGLLQEIDLSKHNLAKENLALRKLFRRDVTFWGKRDPRDSSSSATIHENSASCVNLGNTSTEPPQYSPFGKYAAIEETEISRFRSEGRSDLQIACSYEPRFLIFKRPRVHPGGRQAESAEVRKIGLALRCDQPGAAGGPLAGKAPRCQGSCVRYAALPEGTQVMLPCFSQAALRLSWNAMC